MELIDRFFKPPDGSFFLFGPRGTGKSTFITRYFPDAYYIDLLDPERVPELLTVVHRLIEAKLGFRFTLTGSSARKLKRTGVDLLGGRALLMTMHPFMASELGKSFRLEHALLYGLLPIVWGAGNRDEVLRSYAALYLREEVQMEGLVRNIGNFSRFLEAISFSHSSVLNISNVARECEVERKVVESFVAILGDILLGWTVPIFTKRAKRKLSAHPKFYLFDTGVFRSLRPRGPLDRPEEIDGQALEGLVAQHLRAWIAYSRLKRELFFWRTRSGVEVDFVIYGPDGLWAMEVKNTGRIRPDDLRGLRSFQEEYPRSKAFLLYRGKDRLVIEGIVCAPCEDFLTKLHPARSLDEIFT
jgi:predicted AAA+ superfamily ATPase